MRLSFHIAVVSCKIPTHARNDTILFTTRIQGHVLYTIYRIGCWRKHASHSHHMWHLVKVARIFYAKIHICSYVIYMSCLWSFCIFLSTRYITDFASISRYNFSQELLVLLISVHHSPHGLYVQRVLLEALWGHMARRYGALLVRHLAGNGNRTEVVEYGRHRCLMVWELCVNYFTIFCDVII